jgi:hypothetical protein
MTTIVPLLDMLAEFPQELVEIIAEYWESVQPYFGQPALDYATNSGSLTRANSSLIVIHG